MEDYAITCYAGYVVECRFDPSKKDKRGNKAIELLGKHSAVKAFSEQVEHQGEITYRWLVAQYTTTRPWGCPVPA